MDWDNGESKGEGPSPLPKSARATKRWPKESINRPPRLFPSREVKTRVYQEEREHLSLHLPSGAQESFLSYPFKSVEQMVEKMILLGSLPAEDMTEEKLRTLFQDQPSNVLLPLFGTPVSCGFTSAADDYVEQHLSLDAHLIKNPASTFFVRATGECMKELIHPGDLLVVDRSLEAAHDKIVLCVLNGDFTVKRLIKRRQGLVLRPENPLYNEIPIDESMDFRVWGVVTYIIHRAF